MRGVNASAYVRIPFEVTDPADIDALILRMKYDDGFVAYVNGHEVARAGAPDRPSWNASALGEHGDTVELIATGAAAAAPSRRRFASSQRSRRRSRQGPDLADSTTCRPSSVWPTNSTRS